MKESETNQYTIVASVLGKNHFEEWSEQWGEELQPDGSGKFNRVLNR